MSRTELKRCFVLQSGKELNVDFEKGHNDVALEYIEEKGYKRDMQKLSVDPIKYMVLYLGAAKVGSKTEGKIIEVCVPYSTRKVEEAVKKYQECGYEIHLRRIHDNW